MHYERGFGLVELLLAMSLGLFIVLQLLLFYESCQQAFRLIEADSQIQQNGRFISHYLFTVLEPILSQQFCTKEYNDYNRTKRLPLAVALTKRKSPNGEAIYALFLYRHDKPRLELISGVRALYWRDDVKDVLQLNSKPNGGGGGGSYRNLMGLRISLLLYSPTYLFSIKQGVHFHNQYYPPHHLYQVWTLYLKRRSAC